MVLRPVLDSLRPIFNAPLLPSEYEYFGFDSLRPIVFYGFLAPISRSTRDCHRKAKHPVSGP